MNPLSQFSFTFLSFYSAQIIRDCSQVLEYIARLKWRGWHFVSIRFATENKNGWNFCRRSQCNISIESIPNHAHRGNRNAYPLGGLLNQQAIRFAYNKIRLA